MTRIRVAAAVLNQTPMDWAGNKKNILSAIAAARDEGVEHLDDLLLRRVRLGNLMPEGAQPLLPEIRKIVQPELGWNDTRWQAEEKKYRETWKKYYSNHPG